MRYVKTKATDVHSKKWQNNAHIDMLNEISLNTVINCYLMNKSSKYTNEEYIDHITKKQRIGKKFILMSHLIKSSLCIEDIDLCL